MNVIFATLFIVTFFGSVFGEEQHDNYDPRRDSANIYVNGRFDDIERILKAWKDYQKAFDQKITDDFNNFKKSAETRMSNSETKITDVDTRIEVVRDRVKEVEKNIKDLQGAVEEDFNALKEKNQQTAEKIDKNKKVIDELANRLKFLENQNNNSNNITRGIVNRIIEIQSLFLAIPVSYVIYKCFQKKIRKYFENSSDTKSTSFIKRAGSVIISLGVLSMIFGTVTTGTFKCLSWFVKDLDIASSFLGLFP